MNSLPYTSATELARRIRTKELSVEEVARAYLAQIKRFNPRVNAITDLRSEADILAEAKDKDQLIREGRCLGPLHGLPITVKDSFDVIGLRSSNGYPALRHNTATSDAALVRKLKKAGAIIIGKTNLPLFSIDWQTTNSWFGRTNNPYRLTRVPGGSSGGSAAAVAMGFTAFELGSDAGGSIRVPSHFCGICGIRTTEGALSNRGQYKFPGKPQGHRLITVAGPMARSVEDLQLAMETLWDDRERPSEIPPVDFHRTSWDDQALRIAYSNTLASVEVEAAYSAAFSAFLGKIAKERHTIEETQPRYDMDLAYTLNGRFMGHEIAAASPAPAFLTKLFMYLFVVLKYRDRRWARGVAQGIGISAKRYMKSLDEKEKIADSFSAFFDHYDVWITPVASIAAFEHQRTGRPFLVNGRKVPYTTAMGPFNFSTSIPGHPVVVIPIGQTADGMPLGVQIHGKQWSDKRLLQIAAHLQKFTDGFRIPIQS